MMKQKILVIVPAFNESGNIVNTIGEIRTSHPDVDVVVIDDGSQDATAQEARATGVPVISLPINLGIGGAVQTGFLFAVRNGYQFAAQVDGDGQHDARYLKKIFEPIFNEKAEIVVGSRFLGSAGSWRSSAIRRVGIRFFAVLISRLTGLAVTDPTSGFRAFGPRAVAAFAEDYPQDYPEPESIVTAKRLGFRLVEVPVEMRKREYGQSSIRYLRTLYYMIKVTFVILLNMIKRGPDPRHRDPDLSPKSAI